MLAHFILAIGVQASSTDAGDLDWLTLFPVRDQNQVILARTGTRSKVAGNLVSLGEFAQWRSPRGIDFRVEPSKVRIVAYDRSGWAVFSRASGVVGSASGTLKSLKGRKLTRVVRNRPGGGEYFLTDLQEDYLIDVRWLKGYLTGYSRTTPGGGIRLAIARWKAEPSGTPEALPASDKTRYFRYPPSDITMEGLRIRVTNWVYEESSWEGRPTERFNTCEISFENTGRKPRAIQPYRIGVVDGKSLPCVMIPPTKEFGRFRAEEFRIQSGLGRSSRNIDWGAYRGNSTLLSPGSRLTMTLAWGRTPGPSATWRKSQRLRYSDGSSTILIESIGEEFSVNQ